MGTNIYICVYILRYFAFMRYKLSGDDQRPYTDPSCLENVRTAFDISFCNAVGAFHDS